MILLVRFGLGGKLTFGWVSKQCQAAARSLRSLSVRLLDMVVEWVGGWDVGC